MLAAAMTCLTFVNVAGTMARSASIVLTSQCFSTAAVTRSSLLAGNTTLSRQRRNWLSVVEAIIGFALQFPRAWPIRCPKAFRDTHSVAPGLAEFWSPRLSSSAQGIGSKSSRQYSKATAGGCWPAPVCGVLESIDCTGPGLPDPERD